VDGIVVHFDVMDAPGMGFEDAACALVAADRAHRREELIDAHLMVKPVDRIIPDFAAAGATFITFHPEASEHIDRSLQIIRDCGCRSGLVFNPATPLEYLRYVMDKVDMVLLMAVNPGFGGQNFINGTLNKLRDARRLIDASGYPIRLEVDGGVKIDNIRRIAEAGADTFVAGSAIFNTPDYRATIAAMRAELAQAERQPHV